MKNALKLSLSIAVLLFLTLSFTMKPNFNFVGKYGDEKIELLINKDFTFSYRNVINSNKKTITGYWKNQNGKIILSSLKRTNQLPVKWKFKNDGKTIKARKGMTFYTLQRRCTHPINED
jgi:hypothetical protein